MVEQTIWIDHLLEISNRQKTVLSCPLDMLQIPSLSFSNRGEKRLFPSNQKTIFFYSFLYCKKNFRCPPPTMYIINMPLLHIVLWFCHQVPHNWNTEDNFVCSSFKCFWGEPSLLLLFQSQHARCSNARGNMPL